MLSRYPVTQEWLWTSVLAVFVVVSAIMFVRSLLEQTRPREIVVRVYALAILVVVGVPFLLRAWYLSLLLWWLSR